MVRVTDLTKRYGRFLAVDGLSFELRPGEVAGLLGPNGAGKTTTIRAITGYHRADSGRVEVCGHDAARDAAAARRRIGYLPENAPLYPEMTPAGYLHYRGRLYGLRRRERRAAVERAMDVCRVSDVRRKRLSQLSKGYRQRVGLAAALLHDPPVLVLDEPTNGLDPGQIRQTRALIRDLAASPTGGGEPRLVLVSSHILAEIERTCDRVLILARGRLRADGAPERLLGAHAGAAPVEAEIRGTDEQREALVRTLAGALGAERVRIEPIEGEVWRRLIVTGAGPDVPERVGEAVRSAGVAVRRLARARPTLEDLFIRLIEEEGGPEATPAADGHEASTA